MIIMAVDYGDVRTGIAVCDKFEMLASPVCSITQRNRDLLIAEIKSLAEKHKVEQFVVGLPKNMDSSIGERAIKCQEFADALRQASGIDTVLRDERLSTVSAERVLLEADMSRNKRKKVIDAVAACIILQSYLDKRR